MSETIDQTFRAEVRVRFIIKDGIDPFDVVTGPNGDEFRGSLYPLHTKDDVLDHWAYNAIRNGVRSANELDGWADLDRDDVWFVVQDIKEFEAVSR